ncbi:CIC11C00000000718 [Sungouiella intermedia]|uniref:CIC11C00000000718 n=1 Tax=Sungouiella intermedia TaxID=45354 RepID=A0A1L0DJE0_9ASCO|nr:CIC11C00000000718 [[Candida] intermedia]
MAASKSQSILQFIDSNQIVISRNILIFLYCANFLSARYAPKIHAVTDRFFTLQNMIDKQDGEAIYDIDIHDTYFVIHWVVFLTFLRANLMTWVFDPVAKNLCNIHSRKAKTRFSEQSWSIFYYCFSFAVGLYLYRNSPYWNNLDNLYSGWPHYCMTSLFKKYYLVSIAFWLQQVVVLNIEEKRKDHYQMFSHHIITCALVIGSYYYYFTRIGNLILMIMDSVDIFLSTAKVLKYSGFSNLCDVMFMLFLFAWIALRHGVYNYLFYHAWKYSTALMKDSECIVGQVLKRCWTPSIINSFLGLLGGLQIITCIWMYLILKVAHKVIMGHSAEDVRSDADDTDVEESRSDASGNSESLIEEVDEKVLSNAE